MKPLMRLLDLFEGKKSALAKALGVSPAFITLLVQNKRKISYKLAIKAEKLSNGTVNRAELRPDIWGD